MTSRTRLKVEEARFFLEKARQHRYDLAHRLAESLATPKELLFYLSAFVNACRSVPWVMKSEYGKVDGWQRWYDVEEQLDEEDTLLKAFAEIRNESSKEGRLQPSFHLSLRAIGDDEPSDLAEGGRRAVYTMTLGPLKEITVVVDEVGWRHPLLGDTDFIEACDRYFRLVELLVSKCERLFPLPTAPTASSTP